MTSDKSIKEIKALALSKGLTVEAKSHYQWHIKGGHVLVNYYPSKSTAYLQGTTGGIKHVSWKQAMDLALSGPNRHARPGKGVRTRKWKGAKAAMLRMAPWCFWCKGPLDLDTATIDHKVPLGIGGADQRDNIVIACESCNHKRGCTVGPPRAR